LAGNGFAGSKNGQGTTATFNTFVGIAVAKDISIFVTECYLYSAIRKILLNETVTTFLLGNILYDPTEGSETFSPSAIVTNDDNSLFVAQNRIFDIIYDCNSIIDSASHLLLLRQKCFRLVHPKDPFIIKFRTIMLIKGHGSDFKLEYRQATVV
jgi:hypothetical protein